MADPWVYLVAPGPALLYDYIRNRKAASGFDEAMKQNFGNSAATTRFLNAVPRDDKIDMALRIHDGAASEPIILNALRDVARKGQTDDDRRQNKLAVVNMMFDRLAQSNQTIKHYTDQMTDDQKIDIAHDFVSGGADAMKNKVRLTVWDIALAEKISDPKMRDTVNRAISREDRLKYIAEYETDPAKAAKDIEAAVFDAVVLDANPAAAIFLKDIPPERKAQLIEISDPEKRKDAITKELTDRKDALIKDGKDKLMNGFRSLLPGPRADAGPDATSPKLAAVPPVTNSFMRVNAGGTDVRNAAPQAQTGAPAPVP